MEIKIAIATNKNFSQYSVPVVIKSLIECGIDKNQIIVFHAGHQQRKVQEIDGIINIFLNHNSFEYSPLIDICENNLQSEYWFLLHDTCKVGPKFKELLYNIPLERPSKLSLKSKPSMSMGSYRYDYLKSIEQKLFAIKNTDLSPQSVMQWKLWGVPNEDYIMWMTEPTPIIYNGLDTWELVDNKNWYGTKTQRRTEYYPSLDIYKNKSNWGQSKNMTLVI
jgi:hypothetical protein